MNVLAIDVGGTHVKILATGQNVRREFISGPKMTAKLMVAQVKELTQDWRYDVVSIGYPGPVLRNRPVSEPHNLAKGWVGYDFEMAFKCPVKIVNDAAMQALGSYQRGKMLFLGLGTGLGSTLVVDGIVEPMELGHLPYKKATFEDYVGLRGLEKFARPFGAHAPHSCGYAARMRPSQAGQRKRSLLQEETHKKTLQSCEGCAVILSHRRHVPGVFHATGGKSLWITRLAVRISSTERLR